MGRAVAIYLMKHSVRSKWTNSQVNTSSCTKSVFEAQLTSETCEGWTMIEISTLPPVDGEAHFRQLMVKHTSVSWYTI